ncbi:MAG: phosphoribosylanthranilate isomerase [Oscillospiraceae bacterium]|nr:phosphoribosylanthranilate isomerase [Oscillospiraceae bacterium]
MLKLKLCGLRRPCDVLAANECAPDYIGFVFAPSRRQVSPDTAAALRALLAPGIQAVGVFVDETPETVAALLHRGVIDAAQLHGHEDANYIRRLRALTDAPVFQAFRIRSAADAAAAQESAADMVLLDSGTGSGARFDWSLNAAVRRPYFLAGGLSPENAAEAVRRLHPHGLDVSSGIETDGQKDANKMKNFVRIARDAAGGDL